MVVRLIVELLAPTERMRICDPTAGSGGMLIECAHFIERRGGNPPNLTLHGQEKNLGTWAICKMNMLLHGLPDARIEKGDTIREPKLVEEAELLLYDRVIANPPFSLDEWGRDVAESDGYGRFRFGVPPRTKGDLAFVQHMVAVLNAAGRLGVVMPHGVLFRGSAEGKIRQGLLQEGPLRSGHRPRAEPLLRHRHPGVDPGAEPGQAGGAEGEGAVHRRVSGVRGGDQPEPAAGPGHRAYLKDVPCVRGRGEVRAGGAPRRDRTERLEPQHQPLRGHLRRGRAHRCRRGGAEVAGAGEGTGGGRGDDEPVSGGVGVWKTETRNSLRKRDPPYDWESVPAR